MHLIAMRFSPIQVAVFSVGVLLAVLVQFAVHCATQHREIPIRGSLAMQGRLQDHHHEASTPRICADGADAKTWPKCSLRIDAERPAALAALGR